MHFLMSARGTAFLFLVSFFSLSSSAFASSGPVSFSGAENQLTFLNYKNFIANENLRRCFTDNFDDADTLESITYVRCHTYGEVNDFTGLHYFTSLKNLSVSISPRVFWRFPVNFSSIDHLTVYGNFPDETTLSSFGSLLELRLHDMDIQDTEALSLPRQVSKIALDGVKLSNFDFLLPYSEQLRSLSFVNSSQNTDTVNCPADPAAFSSLGNLISLENLKIASCDLNTQTDWIARLQNLRVLELIDTNIDDLKQVSDLSGLAIITLDNNPLEGAELENLSKLSGLWLLSLKGTYVEDFNALASLESLTHLVIGSAATTFDSQNLSTLMSLVNLQSIDFVGARFGSPEALMGLPPLKGLNFHGSYIESLTHFDTANLETFSFYIYPEGNEADLWTDFTQLGSAQQLQEVNFRLKNLNNLDFLSSSTSLQNVRISDSEIADISGLENSESVSLSFSNNFNLFCLGEPPQTPYSWQRDHADLVSCFSIGDFDNDGIRNGEDSDDDNDGMSDVYEKTYNLNPYTDDSEADPDLDTLANIVESHYGTDPHAADTDGDLMSDRFEVAYQLDPVSAADSTMDPDADSLNNLGEFNTGTNPRLFDTDGDGMGDGFEVQYGLRPFENDSMQDPDADSLNNLNESQAGTNPRLFDTEGDGMSDGFEVQFGLDPFVNDALADPDGDTVNNFWEFYHNTNPMSRDTDNDRMADNFELAYNLNPLDAADAALDPDSDDLINLGEHDAGTNPQLPDTEFDGMFDGFEVRYGLKPHSNDAGLDPDNDGKTNLEEFQLNTNPLVADGNLTEESAEDVVSAHTDKVSSSGEYVPDASSISADPHSRVVDFETFDAQNGWELKDASGWAVVADAGVEGNSLSLGSEDYSHITFVAREPVSGIRFQWKADTDEQLDSFVLSVNGKQVHVFEPGLKGWSGFTFWSVSGIQDVQWELIKGSDSDDGQSRRVWIDNFELLYAHPEVEIMVTGVEAEEVMPQPVLFDFDADGLPDTAVFCQEDSALYVKQSSDQQIHRRVYDGQSSGVPYLGDFDGDDRVDIVFWQPADSSWHLYSGGNSTAEIILLDVIADEHATAAPADYDGDGITDLAVKNSIMGKLTVLYSGLNYLAETAISQTAASSADGKSTQNADLSGFEFITDAISLSSTAEVVPTNAH